MSKDVGIWMPVYVGDMLANTTRLNTEQIGALNLLMLDYWRSGAIPDDAQVIASITRLAASKVKKYRAALLSCGVFEVVEGQWISTYLDGLRDAATENKKEKSERAVKAAEARWGKKAVAGDQSSNASASSEKCTSNAQAMLEHAKTDAKTMLEQCPSSSSSSINKTHTNTGVFAPDLKTLNDMLKTSGAQPVTQEQLSQTLVTFSPHYETHHLTDNQRMGKLVTWIKKDQDKRPSGKSTKPSAGAVNQKWPDSQFTIPPSPETLAAIKKMQDEMEDGL